jgi:hypothetical protein
LAGFIKKREIAFRLKDWNGHEVLLLKSTIKNHISRFHLEESFMMESIKSQFSTPLTVVYNPGAVSEQAIYDMQVGNRKYLQVNVKRKKWWGKDLIVSFYGIDMIPKGREIWKQKR